MGESSKYNNEKPFGNRKSSKSSIKKKTITEGCAFHIGNKQASDHEVTQEFMLNCTKKTHECGNGMSESLRTMNKMDTGK